MVHRPSGGIRQSGGIRLPRASRPPIDPVAGLAGSIAHDYSNLMMIIQNAATLLREDLPEEDPRQKRVAMLLEAADRATRLTKELQAFGRSQLLDPELVRPSQLVRGMADLLRRLVPSDVDFKISLHSPNATVMFDVAQLRVVVLNLVAVAAERVQANGHLHLTVGEETFDDLKLEDEQVLSGHYVTIVVEKTGAAMDAADRKHVFEPRLTGKNLPRGTDLRLATVFGVVTQSGGAVDVASEKGLGTTFRVSLPVVSVDATTKMSSPAHVRMHKDVSGTEVILVVEDDKAVRSMVHEMLERHGYTALEAADGAEALRVAELFNTPPDLLLTDLVMPELSGRELIEELRFGGKLPKVLLMSGYTGDDVLRRDAPAQGHPFIRKPFTHLELAAKVREVLDNDVP
jgi:two-component system, cell cycle sensor histidine kinase and response regulator CckA